MLYRLVQTEQFTLNNGVELLKPVPVTVHFQEKLPPSPTLPLAPAPIP